MDGFPLRLASPLRRLRRHWPALAAGAIFLLAGALVLDDYGISWDGWWYQRRIGHAALDYLAGDGERALDRLLVDTDRYYGAAFEAPLALVERILGLEDSRDVYRIRHLLTHLFFLAGGGFCYLLALRMFGSRALALVAMALFLLHPRLYAHSFHNTKDIPGLVMFMVSLYLAHRAFRRDSLAAFLLCGVSVGLLVNIRITGALLLAAVLVPRVLDAAFANRAGERGRVLLSAAAFALAAMLTLHATHLGLWTDPPGQFMEMIRGLATRIWATHNLFRGEWLYSPDGPPFAYLPVWVGITTPPATLLLALAGAVGVAWRGARRPRDLLRNTPQRFGLLLIALPVVVATAIAVLGSNTFHGWRHWYFLYAPVVLLAIIGLRQLVSVRGRWVRAGAYALAGAAIAVALVSMVRIHPLQSVSFTFLTDRTTPEGLASRYDLDYWDQAHHDVLAAIVGDHPNGPLFVSFRRQRNRGMIPPEDRERLVDTLEFRSGERNFHEPLPGLPCPPASVAPYARRIHGSTLHCVVDPVAYFASLRREALATDPVDRSRFDAYRVGNALVYLRDQCSAEDARTRIFIHVYPVDPGDVPAVRPPLRDHRADYGFEKLDLHFDRDGVRIDGDCAAVVPLPDYPIARIHTGQYTPEYADAVRRAVAGSEPIARARFDVHLGDGVLTYVREECSAEDAATRFFLHVYPANEGDVPDRRGEHRFANLDFALDDAGARTEDGTCAATAPLPAYPIATVRTGQFDGDGERWAVEFAPPDGE